MYACNTVPTNSSRSKTFGCSSCALARISALAFWQPHKSALIDRRTDVSLLTKHMLHSRGWIRVIRLITQSLRRTAVPDEMGTNTIDENISKITLLLVWFANLVLLLTLGITLHLTAQQQFPETNACAEAITDKITALFVLTWSAFGLKLALFIQQLAWRQMTYTDQCREALLWSLLLWTLLAQALVVGGLAFLRQGDLATPPAVCHSLTIVTFAQEWSLPFLTACLTLSTDIVLFVLMRTQNYRLLIPVQVDNYENKSKTNTIQAKARVLSLPYVAIELGAKEPREVGALFPRI